MRRHDTSSNRTIVGLKLGNWQDGFGQFNLQQSHHCGIETAIIFVFQDKRLQQQSHHCGIETLTQRNGSVGLSMQQSHHCGIETRHGR